MEQRVIKPYHLFNHQDSWYFINIEEMFASAIDEAAVRALEMIADAPASPLESHMEELLKKMGLRPEGGGETPKAKKEIRKEPVPVINMSLFLTQSCNLKCIYCYGDWGRYGAGGNMEEKTAFQAVDWLLEQSEKTKKLHVGFFGGEPFLNFLLMKAVVEYAEKRAQRRERRLISTPPPMLPFWMKKESLL